MNWNRKRLRAVCSIALCLSGAVLQGGLLRNGDFEEDTVTPLHWAGTNGAPALSNHSANGRAALELRVNGAGGVRQQLAMDEPLRATAEFFGRFQAEGALTVEVAIRNGADRTVIWRGKPAAAGWTSVRRVLPLKLDGGAELLIGCTGSGIVRMDDLDLIPRHGSNLIENGGFQGGRPPVGLEWTLGNQSQTRAGFSAAIAPGCGRNGGHGVKIAIRRPEGLNVFYPTLKLKAKPGTSYRYSVWMKGSGVPLKINAQALNYRQMYAGSCVELQSKGGWTQVAVDFRLPDDCDTVQLNLLRVVSDSSGPALNAEIAVDDMELRERFPAEPFPPPRLHPATIRVDRRTARPWRPIRFGVNEGPISLGLSDCELAGDRFLIRYDAPQLAEALRELGITTLRWGGTGLNWWDWRNDWMFDLRTRLNLHARHEGWISRKERFSRQSKRQYGRAATWFREYLQLCRTAGISPLICLNTDTDTVESNRELVRRLAAEWTPSPDFELGNELHGVRYLQTMEPFARMIRAAAPGSRIGATEDHDQLAAALERANWHDAWIPHYYYSEPWLALPELSRHAFTDAEYMMKSLMRRSRELHPGRRMWLTEWGWTPFRGVTREKSLLAALWNADVLLQQLNCDELLDYSIYHSLFDQYFGMLNYDAQGRLIRSVPFFAHKMFHGAIREAAALPEVEVGRMPLVYALPNSDQPARTETIAPDIPGLTLRAVVTSDGTLRLLAVNRTPAAIRPQLEVDGRAVTKLVSVETLGGRARDLEKVNGPTSNRELYRFGIDEPGLRETVRPVFRENIPAAGLELPPFSFTVIVPELSSHKETLP